MCSLVQQSSCKLLGATSCNPSQLILAAVLAGDVALTINMVLSGYGILPWSANGTASVTQALQSTISPVQRA